MGNKQSGNKRREDGEDIKSRSIANRKDNISQFQQHITSSNDINPNSKISAILLSNTADNQLNRGGKPLTKPDLIAIIVRIDQNKISEIESLNNFTVSDLNALIRTIIYDVNAYYGGNMIEERSGTELVKENRDTKLVKQSHTLAIKDGVREQRLVIAK